MYKAVFFPASLVKESTDVRITTPEDINRECDDLRNMAQEHFQVITLDTKNKKIDRHLIGLGTLNSTLVHPREVFRIGITDAAAAMILVHNHPSGDPTPSAEDIKITKQLVGAGEVMGIKILDHVIIGRKRKETDQAFLSLRECGLVNFG